MKSKGIAFVLAAALLLGSVEMPLVQAAKTGRAKKQSEDKAEETAVRENQIGEDCYIVFESDQLYLTEDIYQYETTAVVQYRLVDSKGNDITRKTDLIINGDTAGRTSYATRNKEISTGGGCITVPIRGSWTDDRTEQVTVMSQDYQYVVTRNFTVARKQYVASVESSGVYNAQGKKLQLDSDLSRDEYYMIMDFKDQYGNSLFNDYGVGIIRESCIISMQDPMTGLNYVTNGNDTGKWNAVLYDVPVEKKRHFGIQLISTGNRLERMGEPQITIQGTRSSCRLEEKIALEYGSTVNKFQVFAPNEVPLNEDVEMEYSALDVYGDDVQDLISLNAVLKNSNVQNKYFFTRENGQYHLYLRKGAYTQAGRVYDNFRTVTNNSSTTSFSMLAPSRPAAIIGIKNVNMVTTDIQNVTFALKNFLVEDQYGREMSQKELDYFMSRSYAITIDDESQEYVSIEKGKLITSGGTLVLRAKKQNAKHKICFQLVSYSGKKLNNETTYDGYDRMVNNRTESSQYEVTFGTYQPTQFSEYKVDTLAPLWFGNKEYNYDKLKPIIYVYGRSGSSKVYLEDGEYTVNVPTNDSDHWDDGNGKAGIILEQRGKNYLSVAEDLEADDFVTGGDGTGVTALTRNIEIVINKTGDTIIVPVTVRNEDRRVASVNFTDPDTGRVVHSATLPVSKCTADTFSSWLSYTDNYGVSSSDLAIDGLSFTMSVSDIVDEDNKARVQHNGTADMQLEGFDSGDSFTLTFDFGHGVMASIFIMIQ